MVLRSQREINNTHQILLLPISFYFLRLAQMTSVSAHCAFLLMLLFLIKTTEDKNNRRMRFKSVTPLVMSILSRPHSHMNTVHKPLQGENVGSFSDGAAIHSTHAVTHMSACTQCILKDIARYRPHLADQIIEFNVIEYLHCLYWNLFHIQEDHFHIKTVKMRYFTFKTLYSYMPYSVVRVTVMYAQYKVLNNNKQAQMEIVKW